MKRWFLLLWLLAPLPVLVWHFGAGQKWLARDRAQALLKQAEQAEAGRDWKRAETLFREASGSLKETEPRLGIQLEMALARTRYRQGGAVAALDLIDRVIDDRRFRERFRQEPTGEDQAAAETVAWAQEHYGTGKRAGAPARE